MTATEQLCSQMFLMAYSQELLVFSPIDRWETKHTHIQWGKKKSLLFLVERQWSSRSSQYKRKIWSLVKRIKLPYPSKAKREHHKSVNNPRGIWWTPPSILDCQRGVCVGLWNEPSITAPSYIRSRPQRLPNMQVCRISPRVRPTERDYLINQIPRRLESKTALVVQCRGNKGILNCWVAWRRAEIMSWRSWSEHALTCALFNYNIVLKNLHMICPLFKIRKFDIKIQISGFP